VKTLQSNAFTVDVEDWFHILDTDVVPNIEQWHLLESRIERNIQKLLGLLDAFSVKATFFWLGWVAERHKSLVRKCQSAGHEIASHGYAHVLAYKVGEKAFRQDIYRAKDILEDITGEPIIGFRAPGFGITKESVWAFEVIKESGYQYDSSVFPASRRHGGISDSLLGPYFIETRSGHLLEIPTSAIEMLGRRLSIFGGGYLRLANKQMIRWGINKLQASGQPLIVYIHPREIDPDHPRLPLTLRRRFKCYVHLNSVSSKLEWLCRNYPFCSMLEMIEKYVRSFYLESKTIPVTNFNGIYTSTISSNELKESSSYISSKIFRDKLLLVERAMANFLSPAHNRAGVRR
jgi:polysaccharide deacetylase family protein (PEP-CTERM system associated)